uniref:Uncharacterized protein n=1 Tax=Yoonia rhodophyticola TaxID=3137370 RepID=A0AAN0MDV5_9RHOB
MLRRIFVFAAILAGSTTAISQEVRLKTDAARDALDDASLLRQLDDDADPQDYVAAARADYRRLLTALYAEGFYGGTVSITVNGTEAAALSPLAAPGAINEVVITVDPGPRFRFGQTNIEPVAPATAIPRQLCHRRSGRSRRNQARGVRRDRGLARCGSCQGTRHGSTGDGTA